MPMATVLNGFHPAAELTSHVLHDIVDNLTLMLRGAAGNIPHVDKIFGYHYNNLK